MSQTKTIYRIHLQDRGQDLTWLEAASLGKDMGQIFAIAGGCSPIVVEQYLGKAIDLTDLVAGSVFTCADPSKGFQVIGSPYFVERIQQVELVPLTESACQQGLKVYYYPTMESDPKLSYLIWFPWQVGNDTLVKIHGYIGGVALSHCYYEKGQAAQEGRTK